MPVTRTIPSVTRVLTCTVALCGILAESGLVTNMMLMLETQPSLWVLYPFTVTTVMLIRLVVLLTLWMVSLQ